MKDQDTIVWRNAKNHNEIIIQVRATIKVADFGWKVNKIIDAVRAIEKEEPCITNPDPTKAELSAAESEGN